MAEGYGPKKELKKRKRSGGRAAILDLVEAEWGTETETYSDTTPPKSYGMDSKSKTKVDKSKAAISKKTQSKPSKKPAQPSQPPSRRP